jgi:hypothetical protein
MAQGFVAVVLILSSLGGTGEADQLASGRPMLGVDARRIAQALARDRAAVHLILPNAIGTGGLLTRQQPIPRPYRKAASVGAVGGAALGAFEGAMLGRTVGEDGVVPIAAAMVAALGAASGAVAGSTAAVLPPHHGWRRRLHTAAVALAISGIAYRAFGAWIDDPGLGAREFGRIGLGHGAVLGIILIEVVPLK